MTLPAYYSVVCIFNVDGFLVMCIFFFFSSRRRHTRFDCDWSSDVCSSDLGFENSVSADFFTVPLRVAKKTYWPSRSEEHTSELQSQSNLVCRLLLEKKNMEPTGTSGSMIRALCFPLFRDLSIRSLSQDSIT